MDSIWVDDYYVFFTHRDTLLSRIISKVTNFSYTHCGFIYNGVITDAQRSGVESNSIDEWFKKYPNYKYIDIYIIDNYIDNKKLRTFIKGSEGKQYDVLSLFKHLFFKLTEIWIKSKNPEKVVTCSEFFATAIKSANRNLFKENWYKASPKDAFHGLKLKYIERYER